MPRNSLAILLSTVALIGLLGPLPVTMAQTGDEIFDEEDIFGMSLPSPSDMQNMTPGKAHALAQKLSQIHSGQVSGLDQEIRDLMGMRQHEMNSYAKGIKALKDRKTQEIADCKRRQQNGDYCNLEMVVDEANLRIKRLNEDHALTLQNLDEEIRNLQTARGMIGNQQSVLEMGLDGYDPDNPNNVTLPDLDLDAYNPSNPNNVTLPDLDLDAYDPAAGLEKTNTAAVRQMVTRTRNNALHETDVKIRQRQEDFNFNMRKIENAKKRDLAECQRSGHCNTHEIVRYYDQQMQNEREAYKRDINNLTLTRRTQEQTIVVPYTVPQQ